MVAFRKQSCCKKPNRKRVSNAPGTSLECGGQCVPYAFRNSHNLLYTMFKRLITLCKLAAKTALENNAQINTQTILQTTIFTHAGSLTSYIFRFNRISTREWNRRAMSIERFELP